MTPAAPAFKKTMMRRLFLGLGTVFAVSCLANGVAIPGSIDGTWIATSESLGSTLTLMLTERNAAVSGTGSYSTGALRIGTLSVSGTYRPPVASLSLKYDNGEVVRLRTTLIDSDHMEGALTYTGGSVVAIKFARP